MAIASSGKVDYSKLFSQSHANIYNLINNRSNVSDPADSTGSRKFVYVREPKNLGRNFAGFPFIVIPSFSLSQSNLTIDASKSTITFDITIIVYSQDKDANTAGNPSGSEQLNEISDNIIKTINNKSNRDTLRTQGMAHFEVSDSDFDYDELDGKSVYIREFTLSFRKILKVVA